MIIKQYEVNNYLNEDDDDIDIPYWTSEVTCKKYSGDDCDKEELVLQAFAYVIPSMSSIMMSDWISSQADFCDVLDGDMFAVAKAFYDSDTGWISQDIADSLGLFDFDRQGHGMIVFPDIDCGGEDADDTLEVFCDKFSTIVEALPDDSCKIVAVTLSKAEEWWKIEIFKKYGWLIADVDGMAVAYIEV